MGDRTVIVAPTLAEAEAEAEELNLSSRNVLLVSNGSEMRLRGFTVREDNLVRIREESWSEKLRVTLDCALAGSPADLPDGSPVAQWPAPYETRPDARSAEAR